MKSIVKLLVVNAGLLLGASLGHAGLIQHLDAAAAGSVTVNGSGVVTAWTDLSGSGNNATDQAPIGTVLWPSTSLAASGLPGMDLGANRNGFKLFTSAQQDAWLDFTGAAAANSGFAVLVAFKADAILGGSIRDTVFANHGNPAANPSFVLKYETGQPALYISGASANPQYINLDPAATISPGDTVVFAFNYDKASGKFELWDSQSGTSYSNTVAAADFSSSQTLYLGTSENSGQYMSGMIGEVKVFNQVLSSGQFATERDALAQKWAAGTPPIQANVTFDNGAGDNRWTNAPNWNPNGLPAASNTVQIAGYHVIVDAAVPSGPGLLSLANASLTFSNAATLTAGSLSNWSGTVTWTQPGGQFTVQSGFIGTDADQVAAQILLSGSGHWNFSENLELGTSLPSDVVLSLAGSAAGVAYTGSSAADAFTLGSAGQLITQPDNVGASPLQLGVAKLDLQSGSQWILDGSTCSNAFNVGTRFYLAHYGSFFGSTLGVRSRNFALPANRALQLFNTGGAATAGSLYYEVVAQTPATGPNIIVINVDDMAGGQHFNFEGRDCLTPTLDTLVSTGLRFTSAFAASTVCGPSRYSLLTSRWPSRNTSAQFIARYPLNTLGRFGVSDTELETDGQNLGAWLQQAGYRTGMVGKGHLIDDDLNQTANWAAKGLMTYPQTADPATDAATNAKMKHNHRVLCQRMRTFGFDYVSSYYKANLLELRNDALNVHNQEWITRGALDFIEENHNERFFLYMAPTINHGPVRNDLTKTLRADQGYTSAGYLPNEDYSFMPARQAIIDQVTNAGKDLISARESWLDYSIQAILNKLILHGIRNDTLIIFTSDHGEKTLYGPLVWGKSSLYDLGMRVPLVMNWPNGITSPGRTYGEIVSHVDIAPTLLALTGASGLPTRPVDGVSLVPVFNGGSAAVRDDLFCEIGYARSVRTRDRKYIAVRYTPSVYSQIASGFLWTSYTTGLPTEPRPYYVNNSQLGGLAADTNPHYFDDDQLYNLTADPTELTNLYGQEPATAYDLKKRLANYIGGIPNRPFRQFSDASTEFSPAPASAPTKPSNVQLQFQGVNAVQLQWADAANSELGYIVESSTNGAPYQVLAETPSGTTSATVPLPATVEDVVLRVSAYNAVGNSAGTNQFDLLTPENWRYRTFGQVDPTLSNPISQWTNDADGDLLATIWEYAFATNPLDSNSVNRITGRVEWDGTNNWMQMVVPRDQRRQVLIQGRVSTNLVDWLTGEPHTTVVEDAEASLTLQSAVPVEAAPQQFLGAEIAVP